MNVPASGQIPAAAATVLGSFFETDNVAFNVTSEALPGVERSFTSFSTAADEATLSRIVAGQHCSFDLTNDHDLGEQVAGIVVDNLLTSRHPNHEEGLARPQDPVNQAGAASWDV